MTQSKWTIKGTVSWEDNNHAVENLLVEAFDLDLWEKERLGSAPTNKKGEFEISFSNQDFENEIAFFTEKSPDIFCRVRSRSGHVLAQTEVRKNAGNEESFLIKLENNGEKARVKLRSELKVGIKKGQSLTEFVRRYYQLPYKDDNERKELEKSVMDEIKKTNSSFKATARHSQSPANAELRLPNATRASLNQATLKRDAHVLQLEKLGMDLSIAEFMVDHFQIQGVLGLAQTNPHSFIPQVQSYNEHPCAPEKFLALAPPLSITKWITLAKVLTHLVDPPSQYGQHMATAASKLQHDFTNIIAKKTPKVLQPRPTLQPYINYQQHQLDKIKARLKNLGVCDLSKLGTLKLNEDLSLQPGLYLPGANGLQNSNYLKWINAHFHHGGIHEDYTTIDYRSLPMSVNETLIVATVLDMRNQKILLRNNVSSLTIIANQVLTNEQSFIIFTPDPVPGARQQPYSAQDGVSYNVNSYAGGGHHAYDGGHGANGMDGYHGNAGVDAPSLEIYVTELPDGLPIISLAGQRGGIGGRGQDGGKGGNGSRGRTAYGTPVTGCHYGPGYGGDGGDGGRGGKGGRGGYSGRGGSVTIGILFENQTQILNQSNIYVGGGARSRPGNSGYGGQGGKGGLSGSSGAWYNWCSDEPQRKGTDGSNGSRAEYPLHSDPDLAAEGITLGHGAPGEPGTINPPVLYTWNDWNQHLNRPWIFSVEPTPSYTSNPNGQDNHVVQVIGENFGTGDVIYVNGVRVPSTQIIDLQTRLQFTVPDFFQSGNHSIFVGQEDANGQLERESNQVQLTILPFLDQFRPVSQLINVNDSSPLNTVFPGMRIAITGRAFRENDYIDFAGVPLDFTQYVNQNNAIVAEFALPTLNQLLKSGIQVQQGVSTNAGVTQEVKIVNQDGLASNSIELHTVISFPQIIIPVVAHRILSKDDPNVGTNATDEDVRDFFESSDHPHRKGMTLNHIFSSIGIQFVLVDIREHLVNHDIALGPTSNEELRFLTREFGIRSHLNLYLLNQFAPQNGVGVNAIGVAEPDLSEDDHQGGLFMRSIADRLVDGQTVSLRNVWSSDMQILSHEIGHFLTLPHSCGPDTNRLCTANDRSTFLMASASTGFLMTADEINQARTRAAYYDKN